MECENIVIVHGAFGGRHHWKNVASQLTEALLVPVYRVSLTGLGERSHLIDQSVSLETHINDVVNLIDFEELQSVCLIGHSYGGVLISAASDRVAARVAQRIYLDAYLLNDGENFFSHHPELEQDWKRRAHEDGDGWLIPPHWPNPHRDVPDPLRTLTESVTLKNTEADKIPSDYWLFTDGGSIDDDSLKFFYERANERHWNMKDFDWDHNPHRSAPDQLAKALIEAIR